MRWAKYLFLSGLLFAQDGLRVYPENGVLQFDGGLNTKVSENLIPSNQCMVVDNVLFDETLGFKSRAGITVISSYPVSGITCQKIWSLQKSNGEKYFVGSFEDKVYFTVTLTEWTLIREGLAWRLNPIQAKVYQDKLFFTNGIDNVFYFDGNTYSEKYYGEIELDSIRGKYIESHNNKLFIGNFYDGATKIMYNDDNSDATLVASWPEVNFEIAGYQDGDIITGLISSRNSLLIAKKHSLWGLFGYSYDNWEIYKINSDYGVWDASTIQDDKGTIKFLSNKGVVEFNGSSVNKIDRAVEDEFLNANNLEGEYYYWQNTNSVDWAAGTSTGITEGVEEMYLDDLTKVWSSSNTYPMAFSSGTFSNTNINTMQYINLLSTSNWVDTTKIDYNTSQTKSDVLINNVLKESDFYINKRNLNDDDEGTYMYYETNDNFRIWRQRTAKKNYRGKVSRSDPVIDRMNISVKNIFLNEDQQISYLRLSGRILAQYAETTKSDTWMNGGNINYTITIEEFNRFTNSYSVTTKHDGILPLERSHNYSAIANSVNNTAGDFDIILSSGVEGFTPFYSNGFRIKCDVYLNPSYAERLSPNNKTHASMVYANIDLSYSDFNIQTPTEQIITTHQSTGTWTSEEYDYSTTVYLSTFNAKVRSYETQGTTVTFKIRTKADGGAWSAYTDVYNERQIPAALSPCRYVQVLSSFSTTMSSYTPVLQSISVGATRSTGTWISKKLNAGKVTGGWKYFVDSSIKYGQTIDYYIRTATGSTALDSAAWYSASSGDLLDLGLHPSTHTWYQVKAEFSTTDGRQNPILESLTQTYCPVSEPIISASASIEDRYYIAISTGDYTDNRLVRVYDKRGAWTDFTGWNPVDFAYFQNNWYMAEPTGIYMIDSSATTDNGAAITSKWQKYFDMGLPGNDKYLAPAYITGRKGTGNYDFEYSLDNSTHTYSVTIDQSGTGIYNRRVGIRALSGVRGFYQTITSTNAIEIHNLQNYYTVEPLR